VRRFSSGGGRRLALTDTGEMVFSYANEIFSMGRELMSAVRQQGRDRPLRLLAGITDSLPKLVTYELLRPAFEIEQPTQLVVREGKVEALLSDLATHQVDVVLADTPGSPVAAVKSFNHALGSSPISLLATPKLARKLRKDFPQSLDDAPALLSTPNVASRRVLDRWFAQHNLTPRIVAEMEDSALIKVFASEGLGFVAIPEIIAEHVCERYGLDRIGPAEGCAERYYAITVERRLKHPAVIAISDAAKQKLEA
jgi:LysR family transcriptional activator of nhaA